MATQRLLSTDLYNPRNDPDPQMIPSPEMIPNRPRNDPQLILGME